ncbi:MAG: hypothetical protein IT162_05245 [Bryobacterales bacterium]|nr:hypothetical protein [Bryobacterales bacterium]
MFPKPNAFTAVALSAILSSHALANNLFVLPTFTGSATANASVYNGTPLALANTFTTASDAYLVLTRPAQEESGTKYYVVSKSGSNSLITLNAALQPVGNPLSFGQNVTAAAVSPNGQRLLVVAGNLRIYNTQDDTEVRTQFLDVGINPTDVTFTADSTRAFVMSAQAQRITAVDLTTNSILGQISLPGITQGFAAMGPNGLLYVSAQSRIYEINPYNAVFDTNSVRRQFNFPSANLARLVFTPDGTRALVANLAPTSGQAIIYLSLDLATSQQAVITPTDALSGFSFDKIYVASNSRAYAITANTSVSGRKLYNLDLPAIPATGVLQPPVVTEAFFGSLGNISIADTLAFTNEYPGAQRMYVSAPLSLLQQAAQNTIYSINLATSPPNVLGTTAISFLAGPLNYAGPAVTTVQEAPSGIIPINAVQSATSLGGRTLPFGVKVIGASGRPLFNVPVVFSSTTPGVQLVGASITNTNSDGVAMMVAQAPATAGAFSVNVALGSSGLTTSFSFVAGTGTGSGGGGGGSGGTGKLSVLRGDGLVVRTGNESADIVVKLEDNTGKAVVGANVRWAVTQGDGTFTSNLQITETGQAIANTVTDSQGFSSIRFRAPLLTSGISTSQAVITVTAADLTETLYANTILAIADGAQAAPPSVTFLNTQGQPIDVIPISISGKAGQTLRNAIRAELTLNAGGAGTVRLSKVGLRIGLASNGDPATAPSAVAQCDPRAAALSGDDGYVVCDVKLIGRAGTTRESIIIGEFQSFPLNVRIEPGEPGKLTKINGDGQSGEPNTSLPIPLAVEVGDEGGNLLPSASVRWEIIQGQGQLANSTTITDTQGRSSNTLRLGNAPGNILIRATALSGTQPTVTFEARVNVTVAGLLKVSGDNQTTFTGSAFPSALVVQVNDTRQLPVGGQVVNFAITSGSATLSADSATTDSNGRATVTVRAGVNPGPIVITATPRGVAQSVTFNLTAQLPGPVITARDFTNAASGERGSIVPGGVFTLTGGGLAPDLRGCVEGVAVIGQLPTRLANVELQFGSTLAPLFSVCNVNGRETVTFQAPFELTPGFTASLTARVGTGSTQITGIDVKDYQPGTFETTDAQGRRYAVAIRPNGSFVTPENPARYGEVIRVYITGAGQVTPAAVTGSTGAGQPIATDVVVGLNDQGVRIVSAQYARGMVGVYEIQFEVPSGTATGSARSLGILLVRPNGQFIFPDNSPTIAIAP